MNAATPSLSTKNFISKILAIFFALLTGCSSTTSILTKKELPLPTHGEGVILTTLGYKVEDGSKIFYNAVRIYIIIQSLDGTKKEELTINPGSEWSNPEIVIGNNQVARVLLAYSLPPGEYSIIKRTATISLAGREWSLKQEEAHPLKFKVNAGEATYIGHHEFSYSTGKNILGMTIPNEGKIYTKDSSQEDIDLFTKTRPEFKSKLISNALNNMRP